MSFIIDWRNVIPSLEKNYSKDLKPSNLIISKHRGLVIIDYEISSISRLYFKDEQVLTNILRFKGNTPHYMAPEMFPEGLHP